MVSAKPLCSMAFIAAQYPNCKPECPRKPHPPHRSPTTAAAAQNNSPDTIRNLAPVFPIAGGARDRKRNEPRQAAQNSDRKTDTNHIPQPSAANRRLPHANTSGFCTPTRPSSCPSERTSNARSAARNANRPILGRPRPAHLAVRDPHRRPARQRPSAIPRLHLPAGLRLPRRRPSRRRQPDRPVARDSPSRPRDRGDLHRGSAQTGYRNQTPDRLLIPGGRPDRTTRHALTLHHRPRAHHRRRLPPIANPTTARICLSLCMYDSRPAAQFRNRS